MLDFVEHLPLVDSPEAFGLHPNADITYQSNMAKDVFDTIMNIQPKDSSGIVMMSQPAIYVQLSSLLYWIFWAMEN